MNKPPGPSAIISLAADIREQANQLILNLLAEHGITDILPAHGSVLNTLFQESPLPMHRLAKAIGRKKNTVTSLINTLEERGYCRRLIDLKDARVQLIALTPKGEEMRQVQADVSAKLLQKAWTGISDPEKLACVQCLETVLKNLK